MSKSDVAPVSKVTLQEIGDQLGLSKFAVSRALSGKGGVSESTRQRIAETAAKLGYSARRVRVERRSVEVMFQDRSSASRELWIEVKQGIDDEAARCGYRMTVRWTDDPDMIAQVEGDAAGILLVGPQSERMYAAALRARVPAVAIGHSPPALAGIDHVGMANRESGSFVASHLYRLGHRCMIYVHGELGFFGRAARLKGFEEALATLPGSSLAEIALQDDQTPFGFRERFEALGARGLKPTAIFCGNDGVAATIVAELHRMGLRVPHDVSLVGVGDYAVARQVAPMLTTLNLSLRQLGIVGVRQLLSRVDALPPVDLAPVRITLVPRLIERESTSEVAAASSAISQNYEQVN